MAFELMALRGEAPLQLGDDPMDGGEVLNRAARQGAIELVQRALGREAGRALDQVSFKFASEVLLEFSELVSRYTVVPRVVGW